MLGPLRPTPVIDIDEDEWDHVISVNLKGAYLCCLKAVLPSIRGEGWGRIVNFSSTAGKNVSTVRGAHYTAAKAGVLAFTHHLAKEEARHHRQRSMPWAHRHGDGPRDHQRPMGQRAR